MSANAQLYQGAMTTAVDIRHTACRTMSWPTCKVSGDPLLFLCQIEARTSPLAACMEPDLMLQFFARAQGRAVGGDGGVLARLVPLVRAWSRDSSGRQAGPVV